MAPFTEDYKKFLQSPQFSKTVMLIRSIHPHRKENDLFSMTRDFAETAHHLGLKSLFDGSLEENRQLGYWRECFCEIARLEPKNLALAAKTAAKFAQNPDFQHLSDKEKALFRVGFAHAMRQGEKAGLLSDPAFLAAVEENLTTVTATPQLRPSEKFSLLADIYAATPASLPLRLPIMTAAIREFPDSGKLAAFSKALIVLYENEQHLDAAGIREKVIPAVAADNFEIERLAGDHEIKTGYYGLFGFEMKRMSNPYTPENLCELALLSKELPAVDMQRREQNRHDGIEIDGMGLIGLRDAIHREVPDVEKVIAAMVDFYDAPERLRDEKADILRETINDAADLDFYPEYTNRCVYDRETVWEDQPSGEKVIDVLRRLNQNMTAVGREIPRGTLPKLKKALEAFDAEKTPENLAAFLQQFNAHLLKNMQSGKRGIPTTDLKLILLADDMCKKFLQKRTFHDQIGDYQQPWFAEVLKFADLTYGTQSFDPTEFEAFCRQLRAAPDPKAAYILAQSRQNPKITAQSDKLKKRHTAYLQSVEASSLSLEEKEFKKAEINRLYENRQKKFWSGNLLAEISALTHFKAPQTRYEERYRDELEAKFLQNKDVAAWEVLLGLKNKGGQSL